MKKSLALVLSLFLYLHSNFALATNEIPDKFFVTQHWISLTTSFDIETKTAKLGTLYRKFLSLLLTYEFYDPYDNKIAYARAKFFSWNMHFTVYDMNEHILGIADERIFVFFPTFDIYAPDSVTKLAKARMNFWGTSFTLTDPATGKEMALMTRPFFRLKNDWTFKVTNKALFEQKNMDSRVLMTVIAFQGDREYWEQLNRSKKHLRSEPVDTDHAGSHLEINNKQISGLLERVNALDEYKNINLTSKFNPLILDEVATELENNYQNTQNNDESTSDSDSQRVDGFTNYCLDLIQTNSVSDAKKQIILYLLKTRLESALV